MDVETTGLSARRNDIWQLAAIAEVDGEIVGEFEIKMKPAEGGETTEKALKMGNLTLGRLNGFAHPKVGIKKFQGFMREYVNPYERNDKFVFAGYNASFDDEFLREAFRKAGDRYYGSWFFSCRIDVMTLLAMVVGEQGARLRNYQLGTVCDALGIPLEAHDALEDIRATRRLYRQLQVQLGMGAYGRAEAGT